MWQPRPEWQRLSHGAGPSTVGVWATTGPEGALVVKRLAAPAAEDPPWLTDERSFAWWRRPAEVAASGLVTATPGLRALPAVRVEEDEEGLTVWEPWVEEADHPGPFLARALGRFAGADVRARWLATDQLADRLRMTAERGGWPTLEQTAAGDVVRRLWARRSRHLDQLAELPRVLQHGDPVPANLRGRDGDDVLAVDWATLGLGPVGGDLGYLSLSTREELGPLLDAYLTGIPAGAASADQALLGARITAVHTVVTRAEWALAAAGRGGGPVTALYRHPAVAPHLAALQRQLPHLEALL